MKQIIWLIFIVIVAVLLLGLPFQSKFYYFNTNYTLRNTERVELISLAMKALKTKEVPVSSIITYNGKIIGKGYNTVLRDTNAGGHAEINAISDVIKNVGVKNFNALNRDSLLLITTYEPCLMCRGAIIENRIKKVAFIKEKDLLHWIKNEFKSLNYEMKERKTNEIHLQDSLFSLHPTYKNGK